MSDLIEFDPNQPPKGVLRKIKAGWIAAVVFGLILGGSLMMTHQHAWALWTSALAPMFLAYGIAKGNRASAFWMLAFFLIFEIFTMIQVGHPRGVLLILGFLVCFVYGCQGTIQYQRWKKIAETDEDKAVPPHPAIIKFKNKR